MALDKTSATVFTVTNLFLSRKALITHFTANVYCLRSLIATGTPCTIPLNFKGTSKTVGVIFIIANKKIQKGSPCSNIFNFNLKSHKKLKAHNFLPR